MDYKVSEKWKYEKNFEDLINEHETVWMDLDVIRFNKLIVYNDTVTPHITMLVPEKSKFDKKWSGHRFVMVSLNKGEFNYEGVMFMNNISELKSFVKIKSKAAIKIMTMYEELERKTKEFVSLIKEVDKESSTKMFPYIKSES